MLLRMYTYLVHLRKGVRVSVHPDVPVLPMCMGIILQRNITWSVLKQNNKAKFTCTRTALIHVYNMCTV